jgi:uncharacterized membrane protein (UPF0127 family)
MTVKNNSDTHFNKGKIFGLILGVLVGIAICSYVIGLFAPGGIDYNTELMFYNSRGQKIKAEFKVAVADDDKERADGLMFVKNMHDFNGMVFVFDTPNVVSFWMKNTYISLDLIFVDSDMHVVWISEKATPLSEESISSVKPVKYVIELNAGIVADYEIKIGDVVRIVDVPDVVSEEDNGEE